ncbi:MAG: tRNA pseudouridine(38-40) synthase TruA [Cellulosilyticaceae bacterium]
MRIQFIVAYDGTNYHGFAKQVNALTIQEVIETAIFNLTKQNVVIIASGRTDTGVHAKAQCCVADLTTSIPITRLAKALNSWLPNDIVIKEAKYVDDNFHPRYMAKKKTYRYQLLTAETSDPFIGKYCYFYPYKLDVDRMVEAAKYIEGTHDFKCFCASGSSVKGTVRTIYSLIISKKDDCIQIDVCGNGFLYNMVRIIVGTLVEVGRGRFDPEYMRQIIKSTDRQLAGATAPAEGLMLLGIVYEEDSNMKSEEVNEENSSMKSKEVNSSMKIKEVNEEDSKMKIKEVNEENSSMKIKEVNEEDSKMKIKEVNEEDSNMKIKEVNEEDSKMKIKEID